MHAIGLYISSGLFWEGMINGYKDSIFHQLVTYFSERYFSVSFHTYEHIPLGPSSNGSAQMIILAAMIALILSSVVIAITKSREGRLVKRLLREECFSAENGKTLFELGEFRSAFIRRGLSRGTGLSRCVYCAFSSPTAPNEEESWEGDGSLDALTEDEKELRRHEINRIDGEKKIDFETARFYIPEPLKYRAQVRYEKSGRGWVGVLLTVAITLLGGALICRFLPDFVQLLDNLLTLSAPQ